MQDGTASGSVAIADTVRLGVTLHVIALDAGTPETPIGQPFGTLPVGARLADQLITGYGGNVELSGQAFGLNAGLSPREFPVQNWTGGVRLGAADGPVMLLATRDHVRDSLLSYAGVRDPGTGLVWGGVVANEALLRLSHDSSGIGQYVSIGGSWLQGQNVADNWSAESTGAYWRIVQTSDGGLSVVLSGTAMHYNRNLNSFSLGHGGYFSPQLYALAAIPISWRDRRGPVSYEIAASGGVQYIDQESSPYYPVDGLVPSARIPSPSPSPSPAGPTQALASQLFYQGLTTIGPNYNVGFKLAYHVSPHWYVEGYASANNARDYASRMAGVAIKVLIDRVPATSLRLKTLPDWRGRPALGF